MTDNTKLNPPQFSGGVTVRDIDKGGRKTQVVTLDLGGAGAESLISGSLPVTGPLTDDELRASPFDINISGTVFQHSLEYEVQSTGNVDGVYVSALYHIMGGRNQGWSSTSVLGDLCEYLDTSQALMNTPSSGTTLYLVSSSASDTAAGTGARTVRTVYLDASGVQTSRTDTLNGTTPVNIGSGYSFIQWMEVASVGSSETSVGNLSITSTNGAATVATTFERITAGGNRSLSGRFKVPSCCSAYIVSWDSAAIGTTMDTRLRATVFADDGSLSTVYHFLDRIFLASGQNGAESLNYRKLPPNAVVKISAIPGNAPAANKLDGSFSIIVVNDTATAGTGMIGTTFIIGTSALA